MHCAVAAAAAVATAVLAGALLVGDSVRGSLRDLTLQRLGRIDQALSVPRLFRAELATELALTPGFEDHFESAQPALLLRGSATTHGELGARRSSELDLVGVQERFWSLGRADPRSADRAEGVWLTETVASDLQVNAGDELLVRLPIVSSIPADSPLGEKTDTVAGQRFQVAGVLPPEGLARFGLRPSQRPPRAIFIPLAELAEAIDQPGKANALLVAGNQLDAALPSAAGAWLEINFRPKLSDYGLKIEEINGNRLQLAADGLVLPPAVVTSAEQAFGKAQLQSITAYLANTIRVGNRTLPYSTVAGVDSTAVLGPLQDAEGEALSLTDDQIVLNRWATDRLNAEVGDIVKLRFYEPESTHGQLHEREPPLELRLAAIVELEDEEDRPTAAADPRLTPQLAGVTDQESIADWDLPFELVEPIEQNDEDYWDEYSTTPKAFVSHALANRIWATRWGSVSLLRLPVEERHTVESVAEALLEELSPAELGFAFQPVKQQGLDAASGTTPFDGLFLGFSMFLIAAAILLLVLLFRLGIEGRASELGLLASIGFTPVRARQLLGREAICVAAVGAVLGLLLGALYAGLMVTGLRTVWVAAVASPFLELHIGRWSLLIGFALGLGVAWLATWCTLRRVLHLSPRSLLAGDCSMGSRPVLSATRNTGRGLMLLSIVAIALGVWGATQRGEAQAGAFFGVGALVLTALLGLTHRHLNQRAGGRSPAPTRSLPKLALANLARRPGRSTLTIGLVAAASFLLLAISAFRLAPSQEGTGGYDWFATSDLPLHFDLGSPEGRLELGFSDSEEKSLTGFAIESLRVHGGEDASCLNLYQTAQPRVLGVRNAERVFSRFAWSAGGPTLNQDLGSDENGLPIIPVLLDLNTAIYSLHLSGKIGDRLSIQDADAHDVTLEVVGLLKNSLLQGDLVVSDAHFRRLFPGESGAGLFLLKNAVGKTERDSSEELLENRLSDYGFAVTSAATRLDGFLAVQNTYLSTFQSLGGLGLLLGTVGLAVVQLRGVIERRGELALLQAVGFRRRRIVKLVLIESLALLALGLLLGGAAAALALLPQLGVQQTTLPWRTIAWLLATILAAGMATTWLATRGTLRQAILPALRGD